MQGRETHTISWLFLKHCTFLEFLDCQASSQAIDEMWTSYWHIMGKIFSIRIVLFFNLLLSTNCLQVPVHLKIDACAHHRHRKSWPLVCKVPFWCISDAHVIYSFAKYRKHVYINLRAIIVLLHSFRKHQLIGHGVGDFSYSLFSFNVFGISAIYEGLCIVHGVLEQ